MVKYLPYEATRGRYDVTICERQGGAGLKAEIVGSTRTAAPTIAEGQAALLMKRVGPIVIDDENVESLLNKCRTEIEKLGGSVRKCTERAPVLHGALSDSLHGED